MSALQQAAHSERQYLRHSGAAQQKGDEKAALQPPPPGLAMGGAMSGVHGAAMQMHNYQADGNRLKGVRAVTEMEQG